MQREKGQHGARARVFSLPSNRRIPGREGHGRHAGLVLHVSDGKGNSQMGGVMAETGVSSNTGTTTRKPFVPCYSYGEMEQEAER